MMANVSKSSTKRPGLNNTDGDGKTQFCFQLNEEGSEKILQESTNTDTYIETNTFC